MNKIAHSGWRVKALILWQIVAVLLLTSWFVEPTRAMWLAADESCFRFFNDSLKHGSDAWRMLWAITNHRLFDLVSAGLLILVFLVSALCNGRETWFWHISLITVTVIAVIIGTRIGHLIPVERPSGAMVLSDVFRLSSWAKGFETKDISESTFPGDHAMVAMIGTGYAFRYLEKRFAWAAAGAGIIIAMPRVVGGAHWLSDELVGAGFVGILVLSWSFCTPFSALLLDKSELCWRRLFHR